MSLFDNFQQQYSSISAEIIHVISKISSTSGNISLSDVFLSERHAVKHDHIQKAEKLFDETSELLEQMGLEAKELDIEERQKYNAHINSYTCELKKQQADMKKARWKIESCHDELLQEDNFDGDDQRTRLLENSERLDASSRTLDRGYRMTVETEQIGSQILEELHSQRQTIQHSRSRMNEMDTTLGKSSRVLSSMMTRIIQNRVTLLAIGCIITMVIVIFVYLTIHK